MGELDQVIKLPKLGLGTWELVGEQCTQVVKNALKVGYRHIDTAFAYENHKAVAKGMKGVARDECFLTTKFFLEQTANKEVEEICDLALKELEADYLDLLLIHWPNRDYPVLDILHQMQELVTKGKIRYLGVSNFTERHLKEVYEAGIAVAYNQVEYQPLLQQKELRAYCKQGGTELIGYRPFGKGQLLEDVPLFGELGELYGKTAAQIALRWVIESGVATIVKTRSEERLKENWAALDFSLRPEDKEKIDQLDEGRRYCEPEWNEFEG